MLQRIRKHGGGAVTIFTNEMRRMAVHYAGLGATHPVIAKILGISTRTLETYLETYPDFKEDMTHSKEVYDMEVITSLRLNAQGFYKEVTELFIYRGKIIEKKILKYFPPNVQAQKFWLINRQKFTWCEQAEVKHSGLISLRKAEEIPMQELNTEEQEIVFKINMKQLEENKKNN